MATDEALLAYLRTLGATAEDLREFADDLPVLAMVLVLRGGRERLTRGELARRAELPETFVAHIYRAAGLADPGPDDRVFSEDDVDVLRSLNAAEAYFGLEAVQHLTRVIGASMARIAEALVASWAVNVSPTLAPDDLLARARANAETNELLPSLIRAMDALLRQHLMAARRPAPTEPTDGWTQHRAVGFVDLVGSTALARNLTITELNAALTAFEQRASDIVTARGGRVVKLIGDEAMFTFTDPRAACEAALDLAETFTSDVLLPPVRTAVAWGVVLSRDGDFFGPTVNLAARAVKEAHPGTVLVTPELGEHAGAGFEVVRIAPRALRGFEGRVPLAVLRRT